MRISFLTRSVILILLIAVSAITATLGFFYLNIQVIGIAASLLFIVFTWHLISYQTRFFSKVSYFFDAVRNEDSALSFPKLQNDRFLNELSSNLNRINEQLKEIKPKAGNRSNTFRP